MERARKAPRNGCSVSATALVLAYAVSGALAGGCGDDDGPAAGVDAGPVVVDAGSGNDSGPASDAGADAGGARANGTNGAWRTLDPMPEARANFCSAVVGNRVVVIGGNYRPAGAPDFVTTANVHVAASRPDGTLGVWSLAGTYPTPVRECTAVGSGDSLYVLDGIFDDTSYERRVLRAHVDASGMLGAWETLGMIPDPYRLVSKEAYVIDGALVAITTTLAPAVEETVVLRAPLDAAGAPGTWTPTSWLAGFRGQAQYANIADRVWTIGGYLGAADSNMVVPSADGARIAPDGSLVDQASSAALPAPRSFGEANAVDDWIVVTGGKPAIFGAAGAPDVYLGHVTAAGVVDAWTAGTPLPAGRTNHEAVVVGSWLYVLGGALDAGGLDTVLVSQVRY